MTIYSSRQPANSLYARHSRFNDNEYFPGQQKPEWWLETRREDCDSHYNNFDLDLDKEDSERQP